MTFKKNSDSWWDFPLFFSHDEMTLSFAPACSVQMKIKTVFLSGYISSCIKVNPNQIVKVGSLPGQKCLNDMQEGLCLYNIFSHAVAPFLITPHQYHCYICCTFVQAQFWRIGSRCYVSYIRVWIISYSVEIVFCLACRCFIGKGFVGGFIFTQNNKK